MKKFRFLTMAAAAAMMLGGCSDDNFGGSDGRTPGNQENNGEGVYMSLTVQVPGKTTTRSQTVTPGQSSDGNEVGTDEENKVSNVLIILAKNSDNSFIAAGQVYNSNGTQLTGNTLTAQPASNSYKTVVKMQKTKLNDYYTTPDFSREVNIFVFCNPTTDLLTAINNKTLGDKSWLDLTCDVVEGEATPKNTGIWADNGFLMNNVKVEKRVLPRTIDDWDSYKTEATAFDFSGDNLPGQAAGVDNSATNNGGAIDVQRSVARFDFKDGSQEADNPAKDSEGQPIPNTYNVVKNKDNKTLMQVELNRILMANMSNKFYYLPRVSNDGKPGTENGFKICGTETSVNYLVGPYYETFDTNSGVTTEFSKYFNYPFFTSDGQDYNNDGWDNYLITTMLNQHGDNYEGTTENPYTKGTYKFWRYVTENVLPGEPVNQRNGVSTGIIFKGRMIATEECNGSDDKYVQMMYDYINKRNGHALTGNPSTDPIMYSFNGGIYFTWNNVYEQAIANSVTFGAEKDETGNNTGNTISTNINRSEPLYLAVFGTGGIGEFKWMIGDQEVTYNDNELPVDTKSTNYLWKQWNNNKNDNTFKAMQTAIVGQGFTVYQTSIDNGVVGYYCYYFYWNRHNDNNKPGIMGPMEFATVRNNVYKLAVTNIKQLGHPRIPANDPNPSKPDTPDESDDIYLTVTCQVVPWVVRLNNIDF